MKLVILVLLALPMGAGLLVLAAFGATTFYAERASDELCAWFARGSGGLPAHVPEAGPQTRGILLELRKECAGCACRVTRGPHAESIHERAIVISRGGEHVIGLRVGLTRGFEPLILGFWTDKSLK